MAWSSSGTSRAVVRRSPAWPPGRRPEVGLPPRWSTPGGDRDGRRRPLGPGRGRQGPGVPGARPVGLRGRLQPGRTVDGHRRRDRTVKLWDLAAGLERLTLHGHKGFVLSVGFSPDGKYLVRPARTIAPSSGRSPAAGKPRPSTATRTSCNAPHSGPTDGSSPPAAWTARSSCGTWRRATRSCSTTITPRYSTWAFAATVAASISDSSTIRPGAVTSRVWVPDTGEED